MTTRTESESPARSVTIASTALDPEQAAKAIGRLLAEQNDPLEVKLQDGDIPNDYVDALFSALMESAMAAGGRRLAAQWREQLQIHGAANDRAHHAMATTIDLDLRFGMLSPPLAAQAGCEPDVLAHQQQDADCIARLAVRGIATERETHKMRQRLVKQIVKAVTADTRPQTVGVNKEKSGGAGRKRK